jgi:uncharacterized protein YdiU (UPF0061 family)
MMARKLGLNAFEPDGDEALITDLLEILPLVETDMTIFYRRLAMLDVKNESLSEVSDQALMAPLLASYYVPEQLTPAYRTRMGNWLRRYMKRVSRDNVPDAIRRRRMNAVNPKYVLRNYLAQLAIDRAELGDFSLVHELLELMRRPYDEQPDKEDFAKKRPDWARNRPGCSMLSCSS